MSLDFPSLSDNVPQIISNISIPSVDKNASIPHSIIDTPKDLKNKGIILSIPNIIPMKKMTKYTKVSN
jgi:hypothetical protein